MKQKILTLGWLGKGSPPAQARPGRGAHGPGAGAAGGGGGGAPAPGPPSSTPRGVWRSESPGVRTPRIRGYRDGRVLWQVRGRRGVVLVLGASPVRPRGPPAGTGRGAPGRSDPGLPETAGRAGALRFLFPTRQRACLSSESWVTKQAFAKSPGF